MQRWKDFSYCSLFLWNDFSLYRIDFRCALKMTSICVETTLYRNKPKPLKSIPHCIVHMMRCTLGSMIHTTWRTADVKQHFSFTYNWSAKQRNYSTSWELEQRKTFIKWILIGKAEEVLGERFFSSVISESRETTRYRKRSLSWNPWACFHSFFEFSQTFTSVSKTR